VPTRLRALLLFAFLLVLAVGGLPAGVRSSGRRPTVEPTLPLTIDMRLHDVERGKGRARARLSIDLGAGADLDEVELSLSFPETLRVVDGAWLPPGLRRMAKGQTRRFDLLVDGPEEAASPIRLQALMRLTDGRTFSLSQGVTLEPPRRDAAGRVHLGAYEVMAAPLPEQGP
jgi:hypothetical protein